MSLHTGRNWQVKDPKQAQDVNCEVIFRSQHIGGQVTQGGEYHAGAPDGVRGAHGATVIAG
jgi:hypothetical protein